MKYIYLFLIIWVYGCIPSTNSEIAVEDIHFEQSEISTFVGLPIQITVLDTMLLINDFYGDSLIHCISLKDGKLITKFGVRGNGPNEVLSPLYIFGREDSLFVFSRPLWNLYDVNLQNKEKKEIQKKFRVPSEVSLLFPFQDGLYFCSGMFDDKRFWIFNSLGEKISAIGDYPLFWSEESNIPLETRRMFHQVTGYGYSKSNGIAVTSSHVLSLYNKNSQNEYVLKKEILLSGYEYNFSTNGMSSQAKLKPSFMKGAKDLVVTDEYIYILFDVNTGNSGKLQNREIWKFNWDGEFLCKFRPDIDISLLTIDSHNNIITLTAEENPKMGIWNPE